MDHFRAELNSFFPLQQAHIKTALSSPISAPGGRLAQEGLQDLDRLVECDQGVGGSAGPDIGRILTLRQRVIQRAAWDCIQMTKLMISMGQTLAASKLEHHLADQSGEVVKLFASACRARSTPLVSQALPGRVQSNADYQRAVQNFCPSWIPIPIRLWDRESLPDPRQAAKDLLRDTISVNGSLVRGSLGFQEVISTIARVLEGSTIGSAPRQSSILKALAVLHIIGRTVAGGCTYDKVWELFRHEEYGLVIPLSAEADPLSISIVHTADPEKSEYEEGYAILSSHSRYKILATHGGIHDMSSVNLTDEESLLGIVDARFVLVMDIQECFNSESVKMIESQLRSNLKHSAAFFEVASSITKNEWHSLQTEDAVPGEAPFEKTIQACLLLELSGQLRQPD